ncbi:MAG: SulP family inorganic anion transporter [Mariprofundales bacterium]
MSPAPLNRFALPSAGDMWGGMAAASLVLPQAMAFGLALWLPIHGDSGAAALAGLITAALLSLASGVARGTCGMVSAPTGPTLILLTAAAASYQMQGVGSEMIATAVLLTLALAGAMQIAIGLLNLGAIIKFIPYPVVSGFMTGTGILMILSQEEALLPDGTALAGWIPLLTALVTIAAMYLSQRFHPGYLAKIPATVIGLVIGTAVFHLLVAISGSAAPTAWVVGTIPPLSEANIGLHLDQIIHLPLTLIVLSALALALLASLDTLLTAVIADVATGQRHNARTELSAQGGGQLLCALLGGMAGAGTTGASLVAIESGGRRWVALMTGVTFLLLILLMAPVASWLPISVFSGIIIHVSLFSMVDREIVQWGKSRRARLDACIALVVIAVTVYYNLLIAVGLGVALAVIEFLRTQVNRSTIHRRWTLAERTSMRNRPQIEREAIAACADQVAGYDLQGALFFGSADSLFTAVTSAPQRLVILSLRRVVQVDITAIRMIDQIAGTLRQHGGELLLSHASGRLGLTHCKVDGCDVVPFHAHTPIRSFHQTEDAIEYIENKLLHQQKMVPAHHQLHCPPDQSEVFHHLKEKQFQHIAPWLKQHHAAAGDYLFRYGETGEGLMVIVRGEVEALLPYHKKKRMRLAVYGPGMGVGEVAFLNPGPRGADLRALNDVEWVEFSHTDLLQIADRHPRLAMALITQLTSEMGLRLAAADAMLRRLMD